VFAGARRLLRREREPRAQLYLERLAAHELHAQTDPLLVRLHREHIDDVVVMDLRERAAFPQQTPLQLGAGDAAVQNLDRDFTFELRIPRAVDAAEAAFPDFLHEAIASPQIR